ncbi:hypothetical protein ACIBF1_35450 [Spirillospora sp. NPDC050679]
MSEPSPLTFLGGVAPDLPAGAYEITVRQEVSLDDQPATASRTFQVAGERFALPPTAVVERFPPDGSLGDHGSVLPHLVLDRATLPWERPSGAGPDLPWLVLLVFHGDEAPPPQALTLADLRPAPVLEPHQDPGDPVTVIDVPAALLADLMPAPRDLPYLAHVRRTGAGDTAVVLAARPPAAGATTTVHLVSVEDRYGPSGFDLAGADPVRLVSLASWRFACLDAERTFPALARALVHEQSPMRLPACGEPAADAFLSQGYVPVRHELRQGGRTVSWYRGPLVTGPLPADPVTAARTSDGLLRYQPASGMLDTGRAAAWQLGRLVMLQHKAAADALYGWKRRTAQLRKRTAPAGYPLTVPDIDDAFPPGPLALLNDLGVLRGVPLRYLVPDPALLPPETIRFFHLDRGWTAALLDGALSIGRLTPADAAADAAAPPPVAVAAATGALIRSELISGYPGLLADAYADAAGTAPLPVLRCEPVTPGILLCLFDGVLNRLDLHQRPESLHYAVEPADSGRYTKTLRTAAGAEGPQPPPLSYRPLGAITPADLAAAMSAVLGLASFGPAQYARQLLETADRITFLAS